MGKYLKNQFKDCNNYYVMFRRLIHNKSTKQVGIRRLSYDNNNKIVEELKEINRTLNYIYLNSFILNICIFFKSM